MKIYYDCEFLENGETIRLISIGMVAEDGREFYGVVDMDEEFQTDVRNHTWIAANVYPHLPLDANGHINRDHESVMTREDIRNAVKDFVLSTPDPELWAYYAAYDHVAICQLFGRMIDLPNGFPMFTHELMQVLHNGTGPKPAIDSDEHHALADARYNMRLAEWAGI